MEKNPEDPEFWLPSDFLCDDFFLDGGEKSNREAEAAGNVDSCFPGEITFGFGSDPASPVESVTGTESDEEDYIAGLTQKMTRSFLQDDEKGTSTLPRHGSKIRVTAGSPQSTLSPWLASGRGSPSGPSLVSSPPSSPLEERTDDPWDMLYEAAGQVMRLRLNEQSVYGRGLLGPPRMPSPPICAPSKNTNPSVNANPGYHRTPVLTPQQLQEVQKQQLMKQQHSADRLVWQLRAKGSSGGGVYGGDGRCGGRPLGLPSSAWPPLQKQQQQQQQQPGSGMRAVFLTGSGARRESAGTGVFLPRRVGTPTVSRKKPGCSTVLLPDRVVQALNLNRVELGAQQRYPGGFVLDHDAPVGRSSSGLSHQKRNHLRPQPAAVTSQDIRLPPEWTY
ncbi:uncharacterized protein LOC103715497 isoform X2 [Phoenix dactylifera]|uniref:Uncharacterized protein LOC103715497 isoform X2 n=1 Tax=Phoenix dactylifera TaxID=42345 RepID=A0A8B7CL50_PHODC|nr:uncharacterized protein LOC103715497 isoform X2 [Phoenix dactylifera]